MNWQVWYMCAVHARSADSGFGEVYSFVLSHGSDMTCRSHWLILPVRQSIPLAVNLVVGLIRIFPALMESEHLTSSPSRHVFYPETVALSGRLSRPCFHWFHSLTSSPFSYGFTKQNCMYLWSPPWGLFIAIILLLFPCPPFPVRTFFAAPRY